MVQNGLEEARLYVEFSGVIQTTRSRFGMAVSTAWDRSLMKACQYSRCAIVTITEFIFHSDGYRADAVTD